MGDCAGRQWKPWYSLAQLHLLTDVRQLINEAMVTRLKRTFFLVDEDKNGTLEPEVWKVPGAGAW